MWGDLNETGRILFVALFVVWFAAAVSVKLIRSARVEIPARLRELRRLTGADRIAIEVRWVDRADPDLGPAHVTEVLAHYRDGTGPHTVIVSLGESQKSDPHEAFTGALDRAFARVHQAQTEFDQRGVESVLREAT